jgi:hypothetical protein
LSLRTLPSEYRNNTRTLQQVTSAFPTRLYFLTVCRHLSSQSNSQKEAELINKLETKLGALKIVPQYAR